MFSIQMADSASELTVTGKLSITSTQDMAIPVTPGSPNSIHSFNEYKALKGALESSSSEYKH